MRLPRSVALDVGQLGRFTFESGWYAYAGCARGPGGLEARINRHLRANTRRHWHVDYLRAHVAPVAVWYATGQQRRECAWARALAQLPGASIPARRFGASDCSCPGHLIGYTARPRLAAFNRFVPAQVIEEIVRA